MQFLVNLFEDSWHYNNTKDFDIFTNVVRSRQGIKCLQVEPVVTFGQLSLCMLNNIDNITAKWIRNIS